jgi:hypothetical protein
MIAVAPALLVGQGKGMQYNPAARAHRYTNHQIAVTDAPHSLAMHSITTWHSAAAAAAADDDDDDVSFVRPDLEFS